jgi:hypothetical protein
VACRCAPRRRSAPHPETDRGTTDSGDRSSVLERGTAAALPADVRSVFAIESL